MLRAFLLKETRLILRDPYALVILFLMPVIFVVIMSLSLQQAFQSPSDTSQSQSSLKVFIQFESDFRTSWQQDLSELSAFNALIIEDSETALNAAREQTLKGERLALIRFSSSLITKILNGSELANSAFIEYSPSTPTYLRVILEASLMQKVVEKQFAVFQAQQMPGMGINFSPGQSEHSSIFSTKSLSWGVADVQPTSVQQSVPAWLIFAMFFIVIPLSATLLIEIEQGTLARLHTFPVPAYLILIGKLVPYGAINLLQALLMFSAGIWLVPLLGGEALQLGDQAWLLIPTVIIVSFAAISFALLVAALVKTHDQASTLGGLSNLIMGALGGVMVPKFVMPESMRLLSEISPMSWGLDAFLTILLRQGEWQALWLDWLKLIVFSLLVLSIAWMVLNRRLRKQS